MYLFDTNVCIQVIKEGDIAATAIAHGLVLVTHNTKEFERVSGLQFEDWQV